MSLKSKITVFLSFIDKNIFVGIQRTSKIPLTLK